VPFRVANQRLIFNLSRFLSGVMYDLCQTIADASVLMNSPLCIKMSRASEHRPLMSAPFSMQTRSIESFEELKSVVPGARTEVTQVDRGHLQGSLSHFLIDDMPLDLGTFSLGVRSRGVVSEDRITIGMLTACTNRVTHWSYEMRPGDVVVWPPRAEHDARYYGGASVAVISLAPSDLDSFFGSESQLSEPGIWTKSHYRPATSASAYTIPLLRKVIARLQAKGAGLTANSAEFWKHAIAETMTSAIRDNSSSHMDGPQPSALRIVSKVEGCLEDNETRPVHISEICSRLHVSRRTLHRAFHDAIGMGPAAFLRRKRLCSVHKVLRSSDAMMTNVADVAIQYGFANLGRFSGDYRHLFDEYPSQTLVARP
jgi:AraC-like DNA-binding protein